jgi:hypothetical protein
MSLTKQVLVSNAMEVHNSTIGKVKAGKFFRVCGHCDIILRATVSARVACAAHLK